MARIGALRRGFLALGNFWRRAPIRMSRLAFRAFVVSAALSGWAAVVPTATDARHIGASLLKYARALLKGKAAGSLVEGASGAEFVYKAVSNTDVCRAVGVADVHTELRIARLGLWQGVFRDVD